MKLLSRQELKKIKKDIIEQLKNGIEEDNLYIDGFWYIGDNTYISNDLTKEKRFTGNVKKEEINDNDWELVKQGNYELQLVIDNMDVDIYIECPVTDEWEIFYRWIKLDI